MGRAAIGGDRTIEVGDGRMLAYQEYGEPVGAVVVLFQAPGSSAYAAQGTSWATRTPPMSSAASQCRRPAGAARAGSAAARPGPGRAAWLALAQ
jgi:hypothetical protein